VDFDVYRLNWQWGPTTLTWDTVQSGLIDRSLLRGHFRGAVASDSSFITVELDTVMVREWLRTTTSTDVTKFGIALVPTSASGTVVGFQSFTNDSTARRPLLTVIAGNTAGTARDTSTFSGGIDTFAGDAPAPVDPAGTVTIQAGVVRRGVLAFDLSFLSRGTVINSAELQVNRLPAPPFVSRTTDSTLIAHLATGTDLTTFETSDLALKPVAGSATTLAGDIRHIAQSWAGGVNYGLVLRPDGASEFGSFDLFRLHGVRSTSPALRPRLRLTYTVIPLGRAQ
jgi:hypothetical protein